MVFGGPNAREASAVHEVLMKRAVQQHSTEIGLLISSRNLYGSIGPVIRRELLHCVLFSIEKFPSRAYFEVMQSRMQKRCPGASRW